MDDDQKRFSAMVRQNKSTIFTVCYMFSKDQDEVNDLFQEVLIRLWQGITAHSDLKCTSYLQPSAVQSRLCPHHVTVIN